MGTPFLRQERDALIAQEIETYLDVSRKALESYQLQQLLPEGKRKQITFPERPELLEWLRRIELWGLPNTGTWLDQPEGFLLDIEAAMLGRDNFRRKDMESSSNTTDALSKIKDFDAMFRDAPPFEKLR